MASALYYMTRICIASFLLLCVTRTLHRHCISVYGLPLGILSYTLILAAVALRDVGEAQAAVKHVFGGPRLRQLAVLPDPRYTGSWTEEGE